MVYSVDFRWRIVSLIHIYNLDVEFIAELFGPRPRTIRRWYGLFKDRGVVIATNEDEEMADKEQARL